MLDDLGTHGRRPADYFYDVSIGHNFHDHYHPTHHSLSAERNPFSVSGVNIPYDGDFRPLQHLSITNA